MNNFSARSIGRLAKIHLRYAPRTLFSIKSSISRRRRRLRAAGYGISNCVQEEADYKKGALPH
jgi:hypothetical protein